MKVNNGIYGEYQRKDILASSWRQIEEKKASLSKLMKIKKDKAFNKKFLDSVIYELQTKIEQMILATRKYAKTI